MPSMTENRMQHYYACRLLAQQCYPDKQVIKDGHGKPHLNDDSAHMSWSHSGKYAVFIGNDHEATGIDLEQVSPRIQRIQNKFCNAADLKHIDPHFHNESLLLIWTAKECLYKLYGKKEVDFRQHLTAEPGPVQQEGRFTAHIHKPDFHASFEMEYTFFDGYVVTWVLQKTNRA